MKDKIEPQHIQCVGLWKVDYLKHLVVASFLWPSGRVMTTKGIGVGVSFKDLQINVPCHAPKVPCTFSHHQIKVECSFDTVL